VFAAYGENSGNCLMFLVTDFVSRSLQGLSFSDPYAAVMGIFDSACAYGKRVTGDAALAKTFVLNALVSVDNALHQLYAAENGISDFDGLIPADCAAAFPCRHGMLAAVPLITYGMGEAEIRRILEDGNFFLKIKIGSDPEGDGDPEKMIAWDAARLAAIHRLAGDLSVAHTESGHVSYYLDANGRYPSKDCLLEFLRRARSMGALERIAILEEPFPEEMREDVHDVPVRIAADESAHCEEDVLDRIALGYGAVALKPIAKTLSVSFRMAKIAFDSGVPCFCADLTVSPILVDWNKNVASRLPPLPGMKIGVLESNGHQNYLEWDLLKTRHPCHGASWTCMKDGVFRLDGDFYGRSGGILLPSPYYGGLFLG